METPLIFFFLFIIKILISFSLRVQSQEEEAAIISTDPAYYFNLCSNYSCSNISLQYPFGLQTFCGHPDLNTTCVNNTHIELYSNRIPDAEPCRIISNLTSDAASITIPVAFMSLFGCGKVTRKNFITDPTHFTLSKEYTLGIHLNCTRRPASAPPGSLLPSSCLNCNGSSTNNVCFYSRDFNNYAECENFYMDTTAEVNVSAIKDLRGFLRNRGHKIMYTKSTSCRSCESTRGRCGSSTRGEFVCFCPSSVHRLNCSDGMIEDLRTWLPGNRKHKISKGATAAISASASLVALSVIATTIVLCVIWKRRSETKKDNETGGHDNKFRGESNHVNALIDGISPTRYTYSQIKKCTSDFSVKLGEGGFGTVYKGYMEGTGAVAVKLLKRSAQKEKQFMNEVATVGRIHHHNLVGLLGYCAHRSTRALVYEFIEKGSLNKFCYIPDQKGSEEGRNIEEEKEGMLSLTCRQMYSIAVETAKGILYLHEGCRDKILHLDIKPHNVLIDSNLSAKVADFGLARLIDKDHSHLSLTNAQGTPGYAPPEIWSKTYGPITDKSDVYSYGMLLLEIAGKRTTMKSDSRDENNSLFYFPEWVFKKAEKGELKGNGAVMIQEVDATGAELDEGAEVKEEKENDEIWERMCMVGLWCIQHVPSNRPTMRKAIQMLEGSSNEIEMPPNPFPEGFMTGEDFQSLHYMSSVASQIQSSDK